MAKIKPVLGTLGSGGALAVLAVIVLTTGRVPETVSEFRFGRRISFEENLGQVRGPADFVATTQGGDLSFSAKGMFVRVAGRSGTASQFLMRVVGGNPDARVVGMDRQTRRTHYLLGTDAADWHSNVPHFSRIEYEEVYPGVDLAYYDNGGTLEYDFIVEPGADPSAIELAFEGASGLELDSDGSLVVATASGSVRHHAPVVYQESEEGIVPIEGAYRFTGENGVRFELADFDRTLALVIDPKIEIGTMYGGRGDDRITDVEIATNGLIWILGSTDSADFPVFGSAASSRSGNDRDGFVTALRERVNEDGFRFWDVQETIFFGGSGDDEPASLEITDEGAIVIGGTTTSTDFAQGPGGFLVTIPSEDTAAQAPKLGRKTNPEPARVVIPADLPFNPETTVIDQIVECGKFLYVFGRTGDLNVATTDDSVSLATGRDAFLVVMPRTISDTTSELQARYIGNATVADVTGKVKATVSDVGENKQIYVAFTFRAKAPFFSGSSRHSKLCLRPVESGDDVTVERGPVSNSFTDGNTSIFGYAVPTFPGAQNFAEIPGAIDNLLRELAAGDALDDPPLETAPYRPGQGAGFDDLFPEGFEAGDIGMSGNTAFTADLNGNSEDITNSKDLRNSSQAESFVASFIVGLSNVLKCIQLRLVNSNGDHFGIDLFSFITGDLSALEELRGTGFDEQSGNGIILNVAGIKQPEVFSDGFESGDAASWTEQNPVREGPSRLGQARRRDQVEGDADTWVATIAALNGQLLDAGVFDVPGDQRMTAMAVDGAGNVYTVGTTDQRIPTSPDAFQNVFGGGETDGMILKWQPELITLPENGIVGGADFLGGGIAPGSIVSVFGPRVGPDEVALLEFDEGGNRLRDKIGQTYVFFNGRSSPMVFATAGQTNVITRFDLEELVGQTVQVRVEVSGRLSTPVDVPVVATKPQVFTITQQGTGQAALLNQNNSPNNSGNPAAIGSVIQIFLTGGGQTDPPGQDGELIPLQEPFPRFVNDVVVRIGGVEAQVVYAGGAPGLLHGVGQINAVVPDGVAAGNATMEVIIGGTSSRDGVTVSIG